MLQIRRKRSPLILLGLLLGCSSVRTEDSDPCSNGNRSCADAQDSGTGGDTNEPLGGAGGTDRAEERPSLGAACNTDDECPTTARCLTENGKEFFGAGVPRGACVAECTDDADRCLFFEDAVCVKVTLSTEEAPSAYCFPACTHGDTDSTECGERADVACEALDAAGGGGFCRPFCLNDADCPDRHCDKRRGVCSDATPSEDDFGQKCSPDAEDPDCSGICVALGDDYAICSHRCAYGRADACHGENDGICGFASPGGSIGDIGYCAELCDCDDDCTHTEAVCNPFMSEEVREHVERRGVCAPPTVPGLSCE